VQYYHVVFALPAPIAAVAYQKRAALYGLLFDIAAKTLLRIDADPEHLGGLPAGFFLSVRVLSRLFRRRFLKELLRVHQASKLLFFGGHAALADAKSFDAWLAPPRQCEWVVYAKRPFAGPQAVLAYLSRYTHRFAISNSRPLAMDEHGVTIAPNGMPCQRPAALQVDDAVARGVHAPLPTARAA
jgi:hypothetical protein